MRANNHAHTIWKLVVILLGMSVIVDAASANDYSSTADFEIEDDFNDGDVTSATNGGVWEFGDQQSGDIFSASNGDLVIAGGDRFVDAHITSFDGIAIGGRAEWSFRARMRVDSGTFAGVGTTLNNHAALTPGGLRVGTGSDNTTEPIPFSYIGEDVVIQMDAVDSQLTGHVWKFGEFDTTYKKVSWRYTPRETLPNFGVNNFDAFASATFYKAWISTEPIPVPEPSAYLIFVAGLAFALRIRR